MICYEVAFRMYDFVLTHGQRVRVLVNELYLIYTRRFIVYLLLLFSFDSSSFAVLGQYSTRDSRNTANWHTATRKTIKSSVVVCLWIFWIYQNHRIQIAFPFDSQYQNENRKKEHCAVCYFFFRWLNFNFDCNIPFCMVIHSKPIHFVLNDTGCYIKFALCPVNIGEFCYRFINNTIHFYEFIFKFFVHFHLWCRKYYQCVWCACTAHIYIPYICTVCVCECYCCCCCC